jgi:hypothetical protein
MRIALIAASVPELTKRTRHQALHQLAELMLERRWRAEAGAAARCGADRLHEPAWRVAMNQRPPRHHIVDEAVAVDVLNDRARAAFDEQRRTADGLKRSNRAVDTAGKDLAGALEELLRSCGCLHNARAASRA